MERFHLAQPWRGKNPKIQADRDRGSENCRKVAIPGSKWDCSQGVWLAGVVRSLIGGQAMAFAIKTEVSDPRAKVFTFSAQKTMYGGKYIAADDVVFVFASENEGGLGLIARAIVTSAVPVARKSNIARQTPRVSISVRRVALAKRPLGRDQLKRFKDWNDGRPETELNFKFYRQATNKIVGISGETAAFLDGFF